MSNELSTPKIVLCPSESYTTVKVSIAPTDFGVAFTSQGNRAVSYFIGIDAVDTSPQMFLVGDHNLGAGNATLNSQAALNPWVNVIQPLSPAPIINPSQAAWTEGMHQKQGNVGLADGSAQQFTISKLREALKNTGDAGFVANQFNRVAIP